MVTPVSLRALMWMRQGCLGIVVLICLMAIEGHVYSVPAFYSLSGDAVLSLPTITATALCCAALLLQRALRGVSRCEAALWGMVIVICGVVPVMQLLGNSIGEGEMGLNTGLSFVCLGTGQILFARMQTLPFVLTMGSVVLPFIGIVGYLFGRTELFGAMSLQTGFVLVALGTASAARYARRPVLRGLLAGSEVGEAARLAVMGWIAWILLGAALNWTAPADLQDSAVFIFVAVSGLGGLAVVLLLAMIAENRRELRNRDAVALGALMERDPVTGLPYRGLGKLYLRCHARVGPVGMMMIGVDNWDWIVREGGRENAELILRRMSTVIGRAAGRRDMVLRYDDRRFLVLSHGTVGAALARKADRLCGLLNQSGATGTWMSEYSASVGTAVGRAGEFALEPAVSMALAAVRNAERAKTGGPDMSYAKDSAGFPDVAHPRSG
ncbi:hypothetical protein C357_04292 [Citreicella sp. 357]|nr:hypothetical protein C357_04292 [Citreicella sp. 357]